MPSSDPEALAAAIQETLAAAGVVISPDRALRLAGAMATYGDLDLAGGALREADAFDALADLLAYCAALAELADPRRRLARLTVEATDLDVRAEALRVEAAALFGRSLFQRRRGEATLADALAARAAAAERQADQLEARAFDGRLAAARLRPPADLSAVIRFIAAA